MTPYQKPGDIPQLKELNFGPWFDFGGESWIGVVALDANGSIVSTVQLSRLKIDLQPYTTQGQCYRRMAAKLAKVGSSPEGAILLTIETD